MIDQDAAPSEDSFVEIVSIFTSSAIRYLTVVPPLDWIGSRAFYEDGSSGGPIKGNVKRHNSPSGRCRHFFVLAFSLREYNFFAECRDFTATVIWWPTSIVVHRSTVSGNNYPIFCEADDNYRPRLALSKYRI